VNHKELLNPDFVVSAKHLKQLLQAPSDFGYFGDDKDKMFVTWSLGPVIEHRDSGLLTQSNAAFLQKLLESEPAFNEKWRITECNHWAVGWVKHLSFEAADEDGKPTRLAKVILNFYEELKNYPIADENDFDERERQEIWKNMERMAEDMSNTEKIDVEGLPEHWLDNVASYLGDRGQMDRYYDVAESPSEEQFLKAFEACKAKGWTV